MYFICFRQNFQKSNSHVFHAIIENESFLLMGWSYLFNSRCEKVAKVFCKMSQKVYPERPFEFRLSICKSFRSVSRGILKFDYPNLRNNCPPPYENQWNFKRKGGNYFVNSGIFEISNHNLFVIFGFPSKKNFFSKPRYFCLTKKRFRLIAPIKM